MRYTTDSMRIYFSGIGGVGIGPLAEIAIDVGHTVFGSDIQASPLTEALSAKGAEISLHQDGAALAMTHETAPIDWFIYTAALPADHPELIYAREHGIRSGKRDELLAFILKEKDLPLLAVAGTHGKTTTTGMLIWALQRLNVPSSHSVGTTLSFAPSGSYVPQSRYFVYECDEFDRNFLHFYPHLAIIPSIDYDHPDTYPTAADYSEAFAQFLTQSELALLWERDYRSLGVPDLAADLELYDEQMDLSRFSLPGAHNRRNAFLVLRALLTLFPERSEAELIEILNAFPGTGRRFEKLGENLYSDYGHHPVEIAATLQLAREVSDHVVLVYQPHQNIRQHELLGTYRDQFEAAETIYWLPTYLSREDPQLEVLTPEQLSASLTNRDAVRIVNMDDELWNTLQSHRTKGHLVLAMGAGSIDSWVRKRLKETAS